MLTDEDWDFSEDVYLMIDRGSYWTGCHPYILLVALGASDKIYYVT